MRQKAAEEKQRLAHVTAMTSGQWSPIGPQPIQVCNDAPGACSGRVWGIGVDPRNSNVVYIGTDGGGVWGTTDGGTNWAPLTDSQANINIRDLTLAPSAPDTIFAATWGGGVLKSSDDGATWTTLHPSSGDVVLSVAVHPTNASIVLAGGCNEIGRSANGGSTWITTLNVPSFYCIYRQVLFDPTNGNIAYAAMLDGLHRSTDGGLTWSLVGSIGLPSGPFSMISAAIAPSSSNILYLSLKGSNFYLIGFYRSTDSGATWTRVAAPNGDADYWGWSLRVNPTNPNLIYAGCVRLSTSADGGNTWVENDNGLHVDHHVQTYSADGNTLYIGNDGGIWSTTTPTSTSTSWTNLNNTLNTAMFYPGISIDPYTPNITYGGTQDNGTLQYQGGSAWNAVFCGDGGFTAIDFSNPQVVYISCSGGGIFKYNGSSGPEVVNGINMQDSVDSIPPLVMDPSNSSRLYFGTYRLYQTLDGANSWTAISPDLTDGTDISTIAVSPSDPNTIYTGASGGAVYVTHNALSGTGASWTAGSQPSTQPLAQITVDPQNPLTAWAAVGFSGFGSQGFVYKTIDGGTSWSNLSTGLPSLPVNDLLLDPDIANTIYAATDLGVYRSVDGGRSWLPLGTGLPNVIVHAIRLDRPTRTLRTATYGRGMWDLSVPVSGQVAIAISSNIPGAYFTLEDGSTHQAPISFYWYTGAQHTVTWSAPIGTGTRYVFQSWSDSSTANPRTITVGAADATYAANFLAQYLLTTAVSPASGGSLAVNPTSPDGFYNSGQTVTITATPAAGYYFSYFSSDYSGSSPLTITMNAPYSVTAQFACSFSFPGWLPNEIGPGPLSGMLIWTAGAGCQTSAASGAPWLTLGPQTTSDGFNVIPFSVPANTGGSQVASVTFTGDYSTTTQLTQDAAGSSLPNVSSLSPNSGNAVTQVFTLQTYDAGGYARVSPVYLEILGLDGLRCAVYVYPGEPNSLYLADNASYVGPLNLPGTGVLQVSECVLNAATSSVTGSGNIMTVNLGISFKPAFAGSRYMLGYAYDSVASIWGPYVTLGTWAVSANPAALNVTKTADSATVAAGSSIGFTITAGNASASGTGVATGVALNDPLPAGAGINWNISPAYGGPGTCAIAGAVGSQTMGCSWGTFIPGATASVHVTSGTSPASCQAFTNMATLTATGSAPLQASATSTVQCPALTVSGPASLPPGTVGAAYPATAVTATGGSGTYSWSAAGLPNGLTIAAGTGVISGTPTTNSGSPFNVQVTVTDSNSVTANKSYSLTVNAALTVSGPASLPPGTVGVNYPATTATAAGGTGSYSWSATGLPQGLSIGSGTGSITGAPTTATGSPLNVSIVVTDSNSTSATRNYTLTVSTFSPCDINQDGRTDVVDVQRIIQAFGTISAAYDLSGDGIVSVADVQIAINAALGFGCSAN